MPPRLSFHTTTLPLHPLVRLSSTLTPHTSLPTFLTYATQTSLSPTSTLYIGTHYEYTCQTALRALSFHLTRTGGRSDHGIDLLGRWHLPRTTLPALVQCKATKAKAGPEMVRELEGAVMAAREPGMVGVLCGKGEVTRGVREAVKGSGVGVVWVRVCAEGRVRQVVWNRVVGEAVGGGVAVGLRYVRGVGDGWEKEAVLTWGGGMWEGKEEGGEKGFDPLSSG